MINAKMGFCLLALIVMSTGDCFASTVAIDRKEGCAADFQCNCPECLQHCDACTGSGWLTWTKSYTNCSGGTTSDTDCDDRSWDLPWGYSFCSVPANQDTFDVDLHVTTKDSIQDNYPYGDCHESETEHWCHWDVTVHRKFDAEKDGDWVTDAVIRDMYAGPGQMVQGVTYNYSGTGTSSITTGWTFSLSGEVTAKKAAIEGAFGGEWTYSSSKTTSLSTLTGINYTADAADNGQYFGIFLESARYSCDVILHQWGCSGEVGSGTTGTCYKANHPVITLRKGATPAALANEQLNEGLISGGSIQ